ncbi:MAG: PD40 domain-containing protein [Gracilimonas sp.]|nr:PD40 domain-containing protein [Gracilimonas sp.]
MLPVISAAQTDIQLYDYPGNHLDWFTIESEHFLVHFQQGNSRSAQVVSRIAEEIYPPITDLYQHQPDEKVSIVLKDREDYSNGAAYFFDNKIDIWLPALDSPLRGTHNWLRNVVTHEFVHIVQIQKGMKRSRKIPSFYLQWLSYEDVRRPDVLYGFPNGIITMPFATVNVPAWFAEGTAQYQTAGLYYETWDSHRDMILRTRILSDTYFSLDEMATFSSKSSLERETVYNQGFAFTIYLANHFGDEILRDVTEALGQKGVYSVAEAIEIATGTSGYEIFEDWVTDRKSFYTNAIENLNTTPADTIEPRGFFNFYPQLSPDQTKLAYLSNKGFDYGLLSLYLKDVTGENEIAIATVDNLANYHSPNHVNAPDREVTYLETSFSFSPAGNKIAYSINKKNKYGERFRDIFAYDIESQESERLTQSARIQFPAWNHKGDKIAAVQYSQGTQNLVLIYPDHPDSVTQLTTYMDGESVYTPRWSSDDSKIFYVSSNLYNRNIYVYEIESGAIIPFLDDSYIDYRDPYVGPDGNYLYYSSNADGIFNIYRLPLNGGQPQKLTAVIGGAFMPYIGENGRLYYSEYQKDGYKIMAAEEPDLLSHPEMGFYEPLYSDDILTPDNADLAYIHKLNDFDDSDINPFSEQVHSVVDTGDYHFTINGINDYQDRSFRKYEDTYTDLGFYPVLRFDNYSQLHGNNGALIRNGKYGEFGKNLLRDAKPGVYFSSRDVIDKLSLFGGLMVGLASQPAGSIGEFFRPDRLLGLDRDAFLIAEHRGLPFIERSWSPTVAIEIYNMRRNVADGLSIEEFPCTSCLPDTLHTDIAYDIWEAGLFFRSKLSRRSLLELGISYSPYRVSTDNFYSRELQQQVSGSSSQYFSGTTLSASYTFDYYRYSIDADIAPLGLKGYMRYQFQPSKLLEEYQIDDGALKPVFENSNNHSAELHLRYGFKTIGDQAFQARIRGFHYFNEPGDSFYADYVGGFSGMRSYPYFALGGNTTGFTSLSWFAPIYRGINKQAGPYTFDKIFARFFFEAGNGWRSPYKTGNDLKSGVGAEIRMAMNGFYMFPLKFFVSTSYGFKNFTLTLPDDFITNSQSNQVTYGRELLFHFGLTFDFELL